MNGKRHHFVMMRFTLVAAVIFWSARAEPAPPDAGCDAGVRFYWMPSTQTGIDPSEKFLYVKHVEVRRGANWFSIPIRALDEGYEQLLELRGYSGAKRPKNLDGGVTSLEVLLPLSRGAVVLNQFGIARGCSVTRNGRVMWSMFGADELDAREGWHFEIVNGADQPLLKF